MLPHYSTDREILQTALDWLAQGHRPLLVTVARTWGSSPRPVGSLMLMRADGRHCGSVSGGCVEEDLVARLRAGELGERVPTVVDYGIDRLAAARLGLPCGGRLELVIERLDRAGPLQTLLNRVQGNELVVRRVCLATGETSLHPAAADDGFDYRLGYLAKPFGPRWLLLVIGAGHLSQYLARMALLLGFRVTVCDPRQGYADGLGRDGLDGVERMDCMPDDAVSALTGHPRLIVLAASHDPKLDDLALWEALQSPAFYVGAVGSRRSGEARRERLLSLGLSPEQVRRLRAPAGLPIGSHAPPEIALSILAEVTALQNRPAAAGAVDAVSAA